MNTIRLRRPEVLLLILAFGLLAVIKTDSGSQAVAGASTQPASRDRVKELRTQRRDLLRQIAQVSELRLQRGEASLEEAVDDSVSVLKAELELCSTAQERLHVQQQIVEKLRNVEQVAQSHHKAGFLGQLVVDRLTIRRLQAEIELEESRAAAAGQQ